MKIKTSSERASTLVLALVALGLLGLTLLAVMNMLSTQRNIIARSQNWNQCIPICEAGLEDAMAHLNYSGTTNLASDGWTSSGTNYYRSNAFGLGYYSVNLSTSSPPIIISQGHFLDSVTSNYLTRTVKVTTKVSSPYPAALLAKSGISMSGVPVIDSFNSTNPAYSTGGQYVASKAEANAQVDSLTGTVAVDDSLVYGDVYTGPGGSVTINQGIVGDTAFVNNSGDATQIESGHSANDLNTIVPDVTLPSLAGALTFSPGSYTNLGTNYNYLLTAGNYTRTGSLGITGSSNMIITGPVTIYVSSNLTIGNSGYIYLTAGASLSLYVAGPTCSITGAGIINGSATASKCAIYGLPTCTNVTIGGSANYIGTLYAPEAVCTMSGGTASYGAFVANTFKLSGSGAIHYDEALGGPSGYRYQVASWQEQ